MELISIINHFYHLLDFFARFVWKRWMRVEVMGLHNNSQKKNEKIEIRKRLFFAWKLQTKTGGKTQRRSRNERVENDKVEWNWRKKKMLKGKTFIVLLFFPRIHFSHFAFLQQFVFLLLFDIRFYCNFSFFITHLCYQNALFCHHHVATVAVCCRYNNNGE